MKGFRSLRALTAGFLAAFTLATALTGVTVYNVTHETIAELVDRRIADVGDRLAVLADRGGRDAVIRQLADLSAQRDTGDLGLMLTGTDGRYLAGNISLDRRLPRGFSTIDHLYRIKGLSVGRALVRPIGHDMVVTIVAETEPFDDYNAARQRIYLFGFGSIILVVIGGVITFGVIIGRRIVDMRRTVEAIVQGDMERRVPVDGSGSAFDQQAHAFNQMLDRIAVLMAEISNVSHDIAHDLRTPLARLRGRLVGLAQRAEEGPLLDDAEAAIADSDELLAMFAAILRIAEIEGGARRAGFETLDTGALVHHVATTMMPVAADGGHRLEQTVRRHLPVLGDRQLIVQALINLVENAIRHTPPGSRITLDAERRDGQVVMTVADDGPGIPLAERERALRRFGRLDSSRGSAGHGLGLPLVEAIARLHGGSVRLEDAEPGLRVVIVLPALS